jgi:multisubunit Na+/H+ antiporter MnhB subunit
MNRLVRIALTLFISSTILIFLVLQRLERAKEASAGLPHGSHSELAKSELQMVYIGMGMVGVMLAVGVGLIVTTIIRTRKNADSDG